MQSVLDSLLVQRVLADTRVDAITGANCMCVCVYNYVCISVCVSTLCVCKYACVFVCLCVLAYWCKGC